VSLRETEVVPFGPEGIAGQEVAIVEYFQREVAAHVPGAWVDHAKTRVGYEVPFTRYFFQPATFRPLAEIDSELNALVDEIVGLLHEVER
jgi:type I restriction enzyme M protein